VSQDNREGVREECSRRLLRAEEVKDSREEHDERGRQDTAMTNREVILCITGCS
jgi:hypothetical protein